MPWEAGRITNNPALTPRATGLALLALASLLLPGGGAHAHSEDDPLLFMWRFDKLEWRDAGDTEYAWKSYGWLGYDLNKLWIKTEGKHEAGELEKVELQFLWSRAISTYWDLQVGYHHDIEPAFGRNWFAAKTAAPRYASTRSTS